MPVNLNPFSTTAWLVHQLIPPLCPFCAALVPAGNTVCVSCDQSLTNAFLESTHVACLPETSVSIFSGSRFVPPVSDAIKSFKFAGNLVAGRELATRWVSRMNLVVDENPVWIPVPIPAMRKLQRGFNQSEVLAVALKKRYGGSMPSGLLNCAFYRPPMAKQKRKGRLTVQHRFAANRCGKKFFRHCRSEIWLVDDVYTTGTTLGKLAKVIFAENPFASLKAVTLAYTPKVNSPRS